MADVVVDACAMVDALAGTQLGPPVTKRLRDHTLHAPAHFDAEVLSALGRLHRAGALSVFQVGIRLQRLHDAPSGGISSHPYSRVRGVAVTTSASSTPSTHNWPTTSASHLSPRTPGWPSQPRTAS